MKNEEVKTLFLKDDGVMPNNQNLPVIIYLGALKKDPTETEQLFNKHNWLNSWTNGVYDYHHYHSNTHEVLGVIRGSATLQLGGEQGPTIDFQAGDIVVLPAGTGHKKISASHDFQVVGAYPDGMDCNLRLGNSKERPRALEEIKQVPIPKSDPVLGSTGPLMDLWSR